MKPSRPSPRPFLHPAPPPDLEPQYTSAEEHSLPPAVLHALARSPEFTIPADFARRVALHAASLPAPAPASERGYARLAAMLAAIVLAVALFALAPRSNPSFLNLTFDLQLLILPQLGLLAWWLTHEPDSR